MISFILKVAIIIILIILVVNHWGVVADFVNGIVDWIVHYMKIVAAGPSKG